MMTDPIHLHLWLNHFPTVGFMIALGLLGGSLVAKSDDLKQASLVVLLTIPTYATSHAAQMALPLQLFVPVKHDVYLGRTHSAGSGYVLCHQGQETLAVARAVLQTGVLAVKRSVSVKHDGGWVRAELWLRRHDRPHHRRPRNVIQRIATR